MSEARCYTDQLTALLKEARQYHVSKANRKLWGCTSNQHDRLFSTLTLVADNEHLTAFCWSMNLKTGAFCQVALGTIPARVSGSFRTVVDCDTLKRVMALNFGVVTCLAFIPHEQKLMVKDTGDVWKSRLLAYDFTMADVMALPQRSAPVNKSPSRRRRKVKKPSIRVRRTVPNATIYRWLPRAYLPG